MTSAVNLAGPADADRILDLMARYHSEAALPFDDAHRTAAAAPLLEGSPLGAIWLIGPTRAPLGYAMVTFGWSVARAGMIGWLSEAYIRPSVRRRGIGTEVIHAITVSLRDAGLQALHAELPAPDHPAAGFCRRVGFRQSSTVTVLTDPL